MARESTWYWSMRGERVASIQLRADFACVVLMYSHCSWDAEWIREEYPVSLEWIPCYFGGERAWLLCPWPGCGRRVAVLRGGNKFYCRQCWNLAYESQNEAAWDRALTKAQSIRVKLGGEPGFAYDFPSKPKGMHWRTYYRLKRQSEDAEALSWSPWIYRMLARTV